MRSFELRLRGVRSRGEGVVAAAREALELEEHCRCSQVDLHRDEGGAIAGCTRSGKQQRSGSLREATRRSIGRRVVGEGGDQWRVERHRDLPS